MLNFSSQVENQTSGGEEQPFIKNISERPRSSVFSAENISTVIYTLLVINNPIKKNAYFAIRIVYCLLMLYYSLNLLQFLHFSHSPAAIQSGVGMPLPLYNRTLANTTLTNVTITNSTIFNSTLINATVTSSNIDNSTVNKSTVAYSSITNSMINNSTLINSTTTNSTSTNVTLSKIIQESQESSETLSYTLSILDGLNDFYYNYKDRLFSYSDGARVADDGVVQSIMLCLLSIIALIFVALLVKASRDSGSGSVMQKKFQATYRDNGGLAEVQDVQGLNNAVQITLVKQIYMLIMVIFFQCLNIVCLDFLLHCIIETSEVETSSLTSLYYVLTAVTVILLCVMTFLFNKLFRVAIPCISGEVLPWSGLYSHIYILNQIIEFLIILGGNVEDSDYLILIVATVFIVSLFQLIYRFIFVPTLFFDKHLDVLEKIKDFLVCFVLQISILCKLFDYYGNDGMKDILFIIAFGFFFICGFMVLSNELWEQRAIHRLIKSKLRTEQDFLQAMYYLIRLINDLNSSQKSTALLLSKHIYTFTDKAPLGKLIDIIFNHQQSCKQSKCPCNLTDQFLEFFQLTQGMNQETRVTLDRKQYDTYKQLISQYNYEPKSQMAKVRSEFSQKYQPSQSVTYGGQYNMTYDQSFQNTQSLGKTMTKLIQSPDKLQSASPRYDKAILPNQLTALTPENHEKVAAQFLHDQTEQEFIDVNFGQIIRAYLTDLINQLICYEAKSKFPLSINILMLNLYFLLFIRHTPILTIYEMSSFCSTKNKLGRLDQIIFLVNKGYILKVLNQVERSIKQINQIKETSELKIARQLEGDLLIWQQDLEQKFHDQLLALSITVGKYWTEFSKLDEINVNTTLALSAQISNLVNKMNNLFRKLEPLAIQNKDPALYMKYAHVQLHVLNNTYAYEIYASKMKNFIEMNKIQNKANREYDQEQLQDGGLFQGEFMAPSFVIVDGNGPQNFGQIIRMSKRLKEILGWNQQQSTNHLDQAYNETNYRFELLMPNIISSKHFQFVQQFQKSGRSKLIGDRKHSMFIKKANGFIIPAEFNVKFQFSAVYKYTYLATIEPVLSIRPFQDKSPHSIDKLLYFICDNDINGDQQITDYSESFLNFSIINKFDITQISDQSGSAITKRPWDLISDLPIHKLSRRLNENCQSWSYEREHILNFGNFFDTNPQSGIEERVTVFHTFGNTQNMSISASPQSYNRNNSTNINYPYECRALVRFSDEIFGNGILQQRVFYILPSVDSVDLPNYSLRKSAKQQSNQKTLNVISESKYIRSSHFIKQDTNEEDEENENEFTQRFNDSMRQNNFLLDSGSSQSSTNPLDNLANQELRRGLSANDYDELKTSKSMTIVIRLIFLLYLIMIGISSVNLGISITTQNSSKQDVRTLKVSYDRANGVAYNLNLHRVLLNIANGYEPNDSEVANDRYTIYKQLQSQAIQNFKDAVIYLKNAPFKKSDSFYSYSNLEPTTLYQLSETGTQITKNEILPTIYNIFINKLLEINQFTRDKLIGKTKYQTYNSTLNPTGYKFTYEEQTIGLIIINALTPLRRYMIDENFFYLEEAQDHSNSNNYTTLVTAIVSIVAIIIIGLVIAPMLTQSETRRYRALLQFLKIPSSKIETMIKNCEKQVLFLKSQGEPNDEIIQQQIPIKTPLNETQESSNQQDPFHKSSQKIEMFAQQDDVKPAYYNPAFTPSVNKEEEGEDAKENSQQLPNIEEQKNLEVEQLDPKISEIKNLENMKRRSMIIIMLFLQLILTSYFGLAYYLSVKSYNMVGDSVKALETVYMKTSCFDLSMSFLREDIMQNISTGARDPRLKLRGFATVTVPTQQARELFMTYCREKDQEFLNLRRNLPAYFTSSQNFLNELESENMCSLIYTGDIEYLRPKCQTVRNGAYNQGFSNSFLFMLAEMMKESIKYDLNTKTVPFLSSLLANEEMIKIIDMRNIVLGPVISKLRTTCTESVYKYMDTLLNDSITAYSVFVVILTTLFLVLLFKGFKNFQNKIQETNTVLRILPFESFPNKVDQEEYVNFFKD